MNYSYDYYKKYKQCETLEEFLNVLGKDFSDAKLDYMFNGTKRKANDIAKALNKLRKEGLNFK